MLTCCPECGTHFRVTRQQLEVAGGMVRCGHCGAAFDAQPPGEDANPALPILGLISESAPPAGEQIARHPSAAPHPADPPATAEEPDLGDAPVTPVPAARTKSRIPWLLANLLLILALAGQWLWWNRHDLDDPLAGRLVAELCRWVPCQIQPKRAPDRIQVLERSLVALPERPGVLRFQLRLVNRATEAQPYPRLELHLFDHLERPLAARRFFPADYLPSGQDPAGLLAPNQPLELTLDLQDPGPDVIGFRIDFL